MSSGGDLRAPIRGGDLRGVFLRAAVVLGCLWAFPVGGQALALPPTWGAATSSGLQSPSDAHPPGPEPLRADFKVYQLVSVDPQGEEEWVEVRLGDPNNPVDPNDPNGPDVVELGLRLKFDGTFSTGDVGHYFWEFMDTTCSTDPVDIHAYSRPGDYHVRLTVYNPPFTESHRVVKTVRVGEGMRSLSLMPSPGVEFRAISYTLIGNELWALSGRKDIGVADISNPYDLPALQILAGENLTHAHQIVAANGKLVVAKWQDGVDIYQADRTDFRLLRHLSVAELNANSAGGVAALGDVVYVSTFEPGQVLVYDISTPWEPTLLTTLGVGGQLRQVGSDALAIPNWSETEVTIIDIRQPQAPHVELVLDMETTFCDGFEVCQDRMAADTAEGLAIWQLLVPDDPNQPLSVGPKVLVEPSRWPVGFTSGRMYVAKQYCVKKYDITDGRQAPYPMDAEVPQGTEPFSGFLFDPDGPEGPVDQVLMLAVRSRGFESMSLGIGP